MDDDIKKLIDGEWVTLKSKKVVLDGRECTLYVVNEEQTQGDRVIADHIKKKNNRICTRRVSAFGGDD